MPSMFSINRPLRISLITNTVIFFQLRYEKIRLKRLVKQFKENDEEYLKIRRAIQDQVSSILLDGKSLIRLAFYSLIESMRKDPEKYSSLIYYGNNNTSTSLYSSQYYTSYFTNKKYPYQFNSFDSFFEALKSMLLENADKLYKQLLKEEVKYNYFSVCL
jgi:hypothetical protein